ncbi:uncharacterized protein LOC127254690 [Andrographis paniculata]|uniref:uncharacterized protein LOC127254690 n=1 Tax=Andrographis paniculata TaxID=175694 RepID=UPI0021E9A116|nr:uncharacterized protein LOC127254690 [Andrographis paniculata]
MADRSNDFYAVLGLKKDCTAAELKNAYKRLVMEWHPDRFSASGNPNYVQEATRKFQAIQQAYSVLSDANKRFLYDVGVYDSNDDADENGMGEFLNEMATMMSQAKSNENRNETFEELQELFDEMFRGDVEAFESSMCSTSTSYNNGDDNNNNNKRNSSEMTFAGDAAGSHFEGFCMGTGESSSSSSSSRRKNSRRSHSHSRR